MRKSWFSEAATPKAMNLTKWTAHGTARANSEAAVVKLRETACEHARRVRQKSKGRYQHYMTQCVKAFPNHNHIVRCAIGYQSAED